MSICPKNKFSKGHRNQREASWKMGAMDLVKRPRCGELMVPHCACENYGTYSKKGIVKIAN